ncbi:hypothetical protein POM88_012981 [Heracleum sosnowskyi]|uniref:Pentatricopeptide repeat-containing protein n=1 Tax=Heracleum sosnowskyi TaxID=360622 RepID=A0AAD8J1B5_9APIA|nr:hypothetical protein POM88_012981 [Heracleum sosnowskyi]
MVAELISPLCFHLDHIFRMELHSKTFLLLKQVQPSSSAFLAAGLVSAYSKFGCINDARKVFDTMPLDCISNILLWNSILRAHNENEEFQRTLRLNVCNELLNMYGKLGRMDFATKVFDRMLVRTHIFWNTMVSGFSLSYDCDFTSKIFRRMKLEGFEPCEAQGVSEYHY